MDKYTFIMIKSTVSPVTYDVPGIEKEIHRRYGLRISHFQRRAEFKGRSELHPRQFSFFSLCHLLKGEGWYWTPKTGRVHVSQGESILVTPGQTMDYAGRGGPWVEDYICFVGPVANQLLNSGVLKQGISKIGSSRRLKPIIDKAMDPSDDAQIEANVLLQKIIVDLYLENRPSQLDGREKSVENMRTLLFNQCEKWWTVEEMAKECGMSINHMRNIFKQQTGITPKTFIEDLKIRRAAERLCNSQSSVSSIASEFSYRDPYHFSRVFKRVMGMSPSQYRLAQGG